MKTLLFISSVLFAITGYSQDTAVNDAIKNYKLEEIIISNVKEDILLGELNAKSKKGYTIGSESRHAYYFENNVGIEDVFLKTVLFKVQKVKHKTEIRIRLYKKHNYMQDMYTETGETISYASFIPGELIETRDILVNMEPGDRGIVEIDLSKYNIVMPPEGLFVSLEGVAYYDSEGKIMIGLKPKELTWIDFHPTVTDNYSQWLTTQGTDSWFWMNVNKRIKYDFEAVFKKKPSKGILTAPNLGLKVGRK